MPSVQIESHTDFYYSKSTSKWHLELKWGPEHKRSFWAPRRPPGAPRKLPGDPQEAYSKHQEGPGTLQETPGSSRNPPGNSRNPPGNSRKPQETPESCRDLQEAPEDAQRTKTYIHIFSGVDKLPIARLWRPVCYYIVSEIGCHSI